MNLDNETVVSELNVAEKKEKLQEEQNSAFWKKVRLI